jgi:oligopeptide transport system substrate-binding protein
MSRKASKKTALVLTGLSLMLTLLSAACDGLSPEEIDAQAEQIAVPIVATWKAGAPAPTARPTRTPLPAPAAAPTRTPAPTKMNLAPAQVLNLAFCCSGADFNTLDPALVWGGPPAQVVTEAFVGLTRQNEETSEIEPGMATSWDVSADGLVWTFQLRTDVPWVRYNPAIGRVEQVNAVGGQVRTVTAHDFEYGIKRVLDPGTESGNGGILHPIEGAEDFNAGDGPSSAVGVKALDDSTLEIRLVEPAGYLDVIADTWVMLAQPEWQITAHGDEWTETGNFQGYGPYVLKEWAHDSHLTLVKNPYWPGTEGTPQPTVEEITWTLMDDADALLAEYQRGNLDVIELPTDVLDAAQADPQLAAQIAVQPNLCTYYYGFNTRKPPFDDPIVRLAFSLAVGRQALIDDVVEGNQKPARWFSPPGLRAAPTAEEHPALGVAYEPEEARSLLDQVYPDRSLMPPVTLAFPAFGQHEAIAAAVQAMWAENLDVEVELEPAANYGDYLTLLKTDAPQIWRLGWCQYYADTHCFLSYLFHSDADYSNYTNWSSSAFDALAEQAAVSTDTAERAEWYAQAEDILVRQDAVVIPLYWYAKSALTQLYIHRTYSQIHGIERFEKWAVLEH